MPRPKKLNADYFPHDKHMRHHRKLKAIEANFGIAGYAMWCKLLEVLVDCKHFRMAYNEKEAELLAADWGVSAQEISRFIDFCTRLEMIAAENGKIYSPSLDETLNSILSRREAQAERDRQKTAKNKDYENLEGVSAQETSRNEQESADLSSLAVSAPKVKERKGKERELNETKPKEIFLEKKESPSPFAENGEDENWEFPESEGGPDHVTDHRSENSGPNNPAPPGQPSHDAEDSHSTANRTPTLAEVVEFGETSGVPESLCREFFHYYGASVPAWRIRGHDGQFRPFRWPFQLLKWQATNQRSSSVGTAPHAGRDRVAVQTENPTARSAGFPHTFPTIHTNETWHIWSYDRACKEWRDEYGNRPFPTSVAEKGWVVLWDNSEARLCFIPDKWADKGYPTDRYKLHTFNPQKSVA